MDSHETADERLRVQALRRLGILDSKPEERFDRITRIAAALFQVPIALISLVDEKRQWFKSAQGIDVRETPREHSFCAHAIAGDPNQAFVVNDARLDARFRDNPLVTGSLGLRFYAGFPVCDSDGFALGALCVIDTAPRVPDCSMVHLLRDLAGMVEDELNRETMEGLLLQLDESERRKSLILDTLNEGLVLQGPDGAILSWNPSAERLLGLSGEELGGRKSTDSRWRAIREDGTPWPGASHPAMTALATGAAVRHAVMGIERPESDRVWLRVNAQPILNQEGTVTGVLCAFADITTERDARNLAHRASHDELTDLPNRRLLDETIARSLARCEADGTRVGLCFIDLDRFKEVNDTHGHAVGDMLLVRVATCIRRAVRAGDTPARFGGDEFVVVLDTVNDETAAIGAAERIVESLHAELRSLEGGITLGASVGVTISKPGDTPAALLARADAALYRAKATRNWRIELAHADTSC
jgi:diguanylate cyclase (GGDEF)-like protein